MVEAIYVLGVRSGYGRRWILVWELEVGFLLRGWLERRGEVFVVGEFKYGGGSMGRG